MCEVAWCLIQYANYAGRENKGHGKRAGGKADFSLLGQMRHGERWEQLQQERDLVPVQLRQTLR